MCEIVWFRIDQFTKEKTKYEENHDSCRAGGAVPDCSSFNFNRIGRWIDTHAVVLPWMHMQLNSREAGFW
jgi:hypothetical protein